MEKTKEQLIKDYLKANKIRRTRILAKAGFTTEADYFASLNGKITKKGPKKAAKVTPKKELLDYVVAFDTTGSMGSYIAAVKKHVEDLIPQMFSQGIDLRMKIIAFGDYCDMIGGFNFGNAYQQSSFTDNQQELINFVKTAKNTGGGDEDEFYELVIKKIVEETPWRADSKRAVLFIADCAPHRPDYQYFGKARQIDWKEEAKKAAALNIAFDTLSIHGEKFKWYKELSAITKGVYMPFQSSHKMADVFTASAYVRGSKMSRKTFTAAYASAVSSGDSELIGTYKSLSTLLED